MKKLFFFIAIATFSTIGLTSCSEDDAVMEIPTPNPNPNVNQQLKIIPITSTSTHIKKSGSPRFSELNKTVKFITKSGNKTITDAIYYVDGVKINGDTYTHTTIAVVKVQAKRAGYLDSNILEIQFAQKPY